VSGSDIEQFLEQALSNFVADLALAALLGVAALMLSALVWRRSVHDFFGVRPDRNRIAVRLSSFNVLRCAGTEEVVEPFTGAAMSELEYRYALGLAQSVQIKPITRLLRALRETPSPAINEPLVCEIRMSEGLDLAAPVDFDEDLDLRERLGARLRGSTFVLVGEPLYNMMTGYVMNVGPSRFRFTGGRPSDGGKRRTIRVENFYHHDDRPVQQDHERERLADGQSIEYAILERIADWNGSTVFICAGTSTGATVAALRELARWRELADRFERLRSVGGVPHGNFGVLYQIRTLDTEVVPEERYVVERWQYPPQNLRAHP
jgi:hypothetical protein